MFFLRFELLYSVHQKDMFLFNLQPNIPKH